MKHLEFDDEMNSEISETYHYDYEQIWLARFRGRRKLLYTRPGKASGTGGVYIHIGRLKNPKNQGTNLKDVLNHLTCLMVKKIKKYFVFGKSR